MYYSSLFQALFDVAAGTWEKRPDEKGQPNVLSATKVYANPGDAASDDNSDKIVLGRHSIFSQITWL